MTISLEDFWSLLVASQMVPAANLPDLQHRFEDSKGGVPTNTVSLAQWLIAEGMLSRYQAKILLAGRPGPFVYGDYTVYDRHTEGRLQGTFRAMHPGTKHRVLLFFHSGAAVENPSVWQTLVDQMGIYSKAIHPHLVRVYQLYDMGQFKFSVMDDLEGESAEERIHRGPVAPAVGCRFARQAAMGVTKLMELRQAHGVIRPGNIWIDKQGNAQLMLPPLARDPLAFPKFTERTKAEPSEEVLHQADYFAPELFQPGSRPTTQTEVYALGCALFQLITGELPFKGKDLAAKIDAHVNQPLPTLDPTSAPSPVPQILAAALAKDPKKRLQRPDQLADLLRQALERIDLAQLKWPSSRPPSRLPEFESWLSPYGVKPSSYVRVNLDDFFQADKRPLPPPEEDSEDDLPQGNAPRAAGATAPRGTGAATVPASAKPVREVEPRIDTMPAGSALDWVSTGPRSANATQRQRTRQSRAMLFTIPLVVLCIAGAVVVWLVLGNKSSSTSASDGGKSEQSASPAAQASPPVDEKSTPFPAPPAAPAEHKGSAIIQSGEDTKPRIAKETSKELVAAVDRELDAFADSPLENEPPKVIANDGKPLWKSPTAGKPIALAHLAPAVQAVLVFRPAELLRHPEGTKVLASMGPNAENELKRLESLAAAPLAEIEQLTVAWVTPLAPTVTVPLVPMYVLKFAQPIDSAALLAKWNNPQPLAESNPPIFPLANGNAAYLPAGEKNDALVVGPIEQVRDAAQLEKTPALLPRDLEALLRTTDDARLFTFIALCNSSFAEQEFSASEWDSLLPPFQTLIGGDVRAFAVSGHLAENNFFLELNLRSALDGTPTLVAKQVQERLAKLPGEIEEYVASLNMQPYGRRVLLRLPQMLKAVDEFARSGAVGDQALLRCYLPATAAHNLLLGAELALSENLSTQPVSATASATGKTKPPASVTDRLKQVTSLTFARDTLEKAVQLLADDIGVKAEILGPDLQLEGITKNQSFGLDEKQKPAGEILRNIMVKANPDGKLVYVVKPKESGGDDWVFITTRAAAAKRGDKLPPELEAPPAAGKKK